MGTPFIAFLGPSKLEGYRRGAPRDDQPQSIPQTFLDAIEVRESVFVAEQGVPIEFEFDSDDARSCHWVAYASVNKTVADEVRDGDGNVLQPRKSSTRSTPIATLRVVPFPHDPHPKPGGRYQDGVLEGEEASAGSTPSYGQDRATTFHDGREPYVKIGRLAVIKEFRGHHIASLLVRTAIQWLRGNASFFDPSLTEMGLEQMGATDEREIPKWTGLVLVHAQGQIEAAWAKWGFDIDSGMGEWWEEGMRHIGMFQRLDVGAKQMRV